MARTRTKPLSQFGVAIQKALKAKGISGAALCRNVGIHQTTLWRWMVSDTPPRADVAAAIARELGCKVSALIPAAKKPVQRKKATTAG